MGFPRDYIGPFMFPCFSAKISTALVWQRRGFDKKSSSLPASADCLGLESKPPTKRLRSVNNGLFLGHSAIVGPYSSFMKCQARFQLTARLTGGKMDA